MEIVGAEIVPLDPSGKDVVPVALEATSPVPPADSQPSPRPLQQEVAEVARLPVPEDAPAGGSMGPHTHACTLFACISIEVLYTSWYPWQLPCISRRFHD